MSVSVITKFARAVCGVCFTFLFLSMAAVRAKADEPTVVAILPLTGNAADQGEWARRGLDLAEKKLSENGEKRFKLIFEDSKGGDPATAVQAYKSLVSQEKPLAVLTYGSGVGMALSPLVNTDHIVQMGIATSTPKYRSESDFTFRNFPSASLETEFLAKELTNRLKVKDLAIININNDYGVGTASAAKKAFTDQGGNVVFEEAYNVGESNFKSILLKLRRVKVDAVYLAVYPSDGALLLRQAKELGFTSQFIASVAIIGGKDFFSLAGEAAEGLYVLSTQIDTDSDFSKRYNALYPGESSAQQIYVARAYDGLLLIAQALKGCSSQTSLCVRDELFKVRDFQGASGRISFDSAGDISPPFALFKIHGQRFQLVE